MVQAAAWNRTWPVWPVPELAAALGERLPEHKIILIDHQTDARFEATNVIDACGRTGGSRKRRRCLSGANWQSLRTPDSRTRAALWVCGRLRYAARFRPKRGLASTMLSLDTSGRARGLLSVLGLQDRWESGRQKGKCKSCKDTSGMSARIDIASRNRR